MKITQGYERGVPYVYLEEIPAFSVEKSFDCGQCFRFDPVSTFERRFQVGGVALGKYVIFAQDNENELYIYNATRDDYLSLWEKYLSLDCDYEKKHKTLQSLKNEHLTKAIELGNGIRILRQEPWEALCSFIISQNNNIPRIKKIISSLCQRYGRKIEFLGEAHYSFPTYNALYEAGVDEIFALKTGFRAKYIFDACKTLLENEDFLQRVRQLDFSSAEELLCTIKGVGKKVAGCVLLFGFDRGEGFPVDVHIKRTLEKYFPSGLDISLLGDSAGLCQQYLFYYERYLGQ